MCGLAFSGKSTLARKIADFTNSKLIAFDNLWVKKEKEKQITQGVEGWRSIRKLAQEKIVKSLKNGDSVVYDDNNIRFEHREELRKIARKLGIREVVIYLSTSMDIIRQRESINKITGERHEVASKNFQTVLQQLQIPTTKENVVEFIPEMNVDKWLNNL